MPCWFSKKMLVNNDAVAIYANLEQFVIALKERGIAEIGAASKELADTLNISSLPVMDGRSTTDQVRNLFCNE